MSEISAATNTAPPKLDNILRGWAGMMERGSVDLDDLPFIAPKLLEAATLLSELERVGKERDEALERAHYADGTAELAMKHRNAAEALVAEAVGVCEPFADVGDYLKSETEGFDDQDEFWIAIEDHQLYNIKVGSFRAARSFIEKTKS